VTPKTRFIHACVGNNVDRVPLFLKGFQLITHCDEIVQIEDPLRRGLAERVYPLQNAFHVHPTGLNRYYVTPPQQIHEHAAKLDSSENRIAEYRIDTPRGELRYEVGSNDRTETSWHVSYPVKTLGDLEAIRSIPWELPRNVRPLHSRPVDPDERILTMIRISSPVVCVADTMSFEMFLELCATDLSLVERMTWECYERVAEILEYHLSMNSIDMVWIGGSEYVTPPMASPRVYDVLVAPYEKRLIAAAHEAGALVWVHCHGCVRNALDWVANNGADLFEPVEPPPDGDIEFSEAKRLVKDRLTLGGNIESRIIEGGERDEVIDAVRSSFNGGTNRMMLIDSAGSVRKYTSRMTENYHAIIDTWESLSLEVDGRSSSHD
jgi:hypothetical protein